MPQSALRRLTVVAAVLLSLLGLQGCIVVRDSPAPGCVKRIGISPMGGCSGKTAILDLTVEPEISCLSITANNCNGGVLVVRNACELPLDLAGLRIEPHARVNLDVVAEGDEYAPVVVSGNFSDYVPETDERIQLTGTVGEQPIRVTFTKTAKLCE